MTKMNRETKSIAYAFIASGVQIYFGDENDLFVTSKLICSNCGGPWYMNLTECFLCGSLNDFLYKCAECDSFTSITNSSVKCSKCGSTDLYLACPNPDCISNTDNQLSQEIKELGGVFNKESGFLISQQYCLFCGSQLHKYMNYKVKVIETVPDSISLEATRLDPTISKENSYLIIKKKENGKISYGICNPINIRNPKKEVNTWYDNFEELVKLLYPYQERSD